MSGCGDTVGLSPDIVCSHIEGTEIDRDGVHTQGTAFKRLD